MVPEIGKNIISVSLLLKEGGILIGDNNTMKVELNGDVLVFTKHHHDGLYYTKLKRTKRSSSYNNEYKCNIITHESPDDEDEWKIVEPKDKKKWPKMSREEAHQKWGHPHLAQLNKMAVFHKVNVHDKMPKCSGCGLIKSRVMQTSRTYNKKATNKGERLFVDTTGPYPKSREGKKY